LKKFTLSLLAVSVAILMISSVYAPRPVIDVVVPDPCERCGCGFTPGFWKHNLKVYLTELGELDFGGAYSAFDRDGYYYSAGTKLDFDIMQDLLDDMSWMGFTPMELLGFLEEPGWSLNRINTANWLNYYAGYGPF
jgi:hypothetical protein